MNYEPKIKIFENADDLANSLAFDFQRAVNITAQSHRSFYIALSGGTTPIIFFECLAKPTYQKHIPWQYIHLFWVDERCVLPAHPDSNYGATRRTLLDHISIPDTNIHRIRGEENPVQEVNRYAEEIENTVPNNNTKLPQFDWILLGLGSDGHTASIFPGSNILTEKKHICAVAIHPVSGQKRITLTLPIINNAKRILFFVTGKSKASVVASIFNESDDSKLFPAAHVHSEHGILEWYLDRSAGALLGNNQHLIRK